MYKFFILSSGRSGTKMLSQLLDESSYTVLHEPIERDKIQCQLAHNSQDTAYEYIDKIRSKQIKELSQDKPYGEVNSSLRYHAQALQKCYPEAKFIHLIRNGKDFIRSCMSRQTFKSYDKNTQLFNTPYDTRFKNICWMWKEDNIYLNKHINNHIRLEDITTDYYKFSTSILDHLNIRLSLRTWDKYVSRRINATKKYMYPKYENWNNMSKDIFSDICGEVIETFNYDI